MKSGRIFFTLLNLFAGMFCVYVGVFLADIDQVFVFQSPGEDAFRLIQAHWIAVGIVAVLVGALSADFIGRWAPTLKRPFAFFG